MSMNSDPRCDKCGNFTYGRGNHVCPPFDSDGKRLPSREAVEKAMYQMNDAEKSRIEEIKSIIPWYSGDGSNIRLRRRAGVKRKDYEAAFDRWKAKGNTIDPDGFDWGKFVFRIELGCNSAPCGHEDYEEIYIIDEEEK